MIITPHPKCGPLGVFETIENAAKFIEIYRGNIAGHPVIFECEYEQEEDPKRRYFFNGYMISSGPFPDGTDFASSVKLIKEVVR